MNKKSLGVQKNPWLAISVTLGILQYKNVYGVFIDTETLTMGQRIRVESPRSDGYELIGVPFHSSSSAGGK